MTETEKLTAQVSALFKEKKHTEIIELLSDEVLERHDTFRLYVGRAIASYQEGDYEKAVGDYSMAIRLNPNNPLVYTSRGTTWNQIGDHDKAIADFDQAIRLNPDEMDAHLSRGLIWYKKGDYDKAIADNNEVIKLQPDFAEAYVNRGAAWGQKGEYEKALADFERAIRLQADYANAYHGCGFVWSAKGDQNRAIQYYDEAIRLQSDFAYVYVNRAAAWNIKGDHDKAIADCDRAIILSPNYSYAYCNRGISWNEKGYYDKALADYDQAIMLKPDFASAYINRGNTWNKKDDFRKAIDDFDRASYYDPKLIIAYLAKSYILLKDDMSDSRQTELSEYFKIDKDSTIPYAKSLGFQCMYRALHLAISGRKKPGQDDIHSILNWFLATSRLQSSMAVLPLLEAHAEHYQDSLRYGKAIDGIYRDKDVLTTLLENKPAQEDQYNYMLRQAILYHYWSDPITAYTCLYDLPEDTEKPDLCHIYYLLISAYEILAPQYDNIREDALGHAAKTMKDNTASELQYYYAGHIFLHTGMTEDALKAFLIAHQSGHLPSLYMYILCLYKNGNKEMDALCHDLIFEREYKLAIAVGREGFLSGWDVAEVGLDGILRHFQKFLHYGEINEALLIVYDYIDRLRAQLTEKVNPELINSIRNELREAENKEPTEEEIKNKYLSAEGDKKADEVFVRTYIRLSYIQQYQDKRRLINNMRALSGYDYTRESENIRSIREDTGAIAALEKKIWTDGWDIMHLTELIDSAKKGSNTVWLDSLSSLLLGRISVDMDIHKRVVKQPYYRLLEFLLVKDFITKDDYFKLTLFLFTKFQVYPHSEWHLSHKKKMLDFTGHHIKGQGEDALGALITNEINLADKFSDLFEKLSEYQYLANIIHDYLWQSNHVYFPLGPDFLMSIAVKTLIRKLFSSGETDKIKSMTYRNYCDNFVELFYSQMVTSLANMDGIKGNEISSEVMK